MASPSSFCSCLTAELTPLLGMIALAATGPPIGYVSMAFEVPRELTGAIGLLSNVWKRAENPAAPSAEGRSRPWLDHGEIRAAGADRAFAPPDT